MITVLVVSKDGIIKEREIEEGQLLFKVAGFRNDNGFLVLDIFKIKSNNIEYRIYLYGKTKGKSVDINKYPFYPSSEKKIVGNCLLVYHSIDNSIISLTINEWDQIKEEIFHLLSEKRCLDINDDVKKDIKKNIKKKEVKKLIVVPNLMIHEKGEQNKVENTPYLDCSKELCFENFV